MSRHTYYWTCPYCGDNNDPGEKCDCMKKIDLLPNTSSITKQSKEVNKEHAARDKK